jgi:hypothetical protein
MISKTFDGDYPKNLRVRFLDGDVWKERRATRVEKFAHRRETKRLRRSEMEGRVRCVTLSDE